MRRLAGLLLLCGLAACRGGAVPPRATVPADASSRPVVPAASATPEVVASVPAVLRPGASSKGNGGTAIAPIPALTGKVKVPTGLVARHGGRLAKNGAGDAVWLISDNGGGIISNNGGTLISDNGGSVISNNGGSVISNNGGSLTSKTKRALLAAPDEALLAGATVRVLDASGNPVKGADGTPIVAATNAEGQYSLPALPDAHNLVLQVDLPAGAGDVQAFATRGGAATVDLNTVSTLTTAYVLGQYVTSQPNPIATLDKLPANVEADTRAKAATALAAGITAVPDALTADQVTATVTALRTHDTSLDQQLELVKKLLVAVGQSNLGAGLPATQVDLTQVKRLDVSPDGTLAIVTARRIWLLAKDGTLVAFHDAAAGAGTDIVDATFDSQGRLLLLEPGPGAGAALQVSRLAPDGTASLIGTLGDGTTQGLAVLPGAGDEALVLTRSNATPGPGQSADETLWSVVSGKPASVKSQPTGLWPPIGRDDSGALYGNGASGIVTLAPGATKTTLLASNLQSAPIASGGAAVDAHGNLLAYVGTGLGLEKPGGALQTIASAMPDQAVFIAPQGVLLGALAADGSAYVAGAEMTIALGTPRWTVYHVANGHVTLVAGRTQVATGTTDAVALHSPTSVAVRPDGSWVVWDNRDILRIGTDKAVSTLMSFPPSITSQSSCLKLRTDAAGNAYLTRSVFDMAANAENVQLQRIAPDGTPSVAGTIAPVNPASAIFPVDLAVAPDGTAAVLDGDGLVIGLPAHQKVLPLDGVTGTTVGPHGGFYLAKLAPIDQVGAQDRPVAGAIATDPGGQLYLARADHTDRVAADGTLTRVADVGVGIDDIFTVDAKGRLVFARPGSNHQATIERYDPTTRATTTLAGPDTSLFSGTGVDDSIDGVGDLAFAADGALLVVDTGHKQVKRIPPDQL